MIITVIFLDLAVGKYVWLHHSPIMEKIGKFICLENTYVHIKATRVPRHW